MYLVGKKKASLEREAELVGEPGAGLREIVRDDGLAHVGCDLLAFRFVLGDAETVLLEMSEVTVAGGAIPQWVSIVGLIIAGILSLMLWRESRTGA